jgi:hypothetical protein
MGKPAPLGNKFATKLKQPDHRKMAYEQYCAHMAAGYSKKSWCFRHPTDITKSLTYQSMEKYMVENPTEFNPILMEMAQSDGMKYYEDEGRKLMQGRYKNGSPEVWKTCMRNKYDWDKEMIDKTEKCSADGILEIIRNLSPDKVKHYQKIKGK